MVSIVCNLRKLSVATSALLARRVRAVSFPFEHHDALCCSLEQSVGCSFERLT